MYTLFALIAEPVSALLYLKVDWLMYKLELPLFTEIAPPFVPAVLFSNVEPATFKSPMLYTAPPSAPALFSRNVELTTTVFCAK